MLESVLSQMAEKLEESNELDAAQIEHLMKALDAGRLRSTAALSAVLEEAADNVEARTDED